MVPLQKRWFSLVLLMRYFFSFNALKPNNTIKVNLIYDYNKNKIFCPRMTYIVEIRNTNNDFLHYCIFPMVGRGSDRLLTCPIGSLSKTKKTDVNISFLVGQKGFKRINKINLYWNVNELSCLYLTSAYF